MRALDLHVAMSAKSAEHANSDRSNLAIPSIEIYFSSRPIYEYMRLFQRTLYLSLVASFDLTWVYCVA